MTEPKIVTSEKYSLSIRDLFRGLVVAVIGAVLPIAQELLTAWQSGEDIEMKWRTVVATAIQAGIAYLLLNYFSNSKVIAVTGKTHLKEAEQKIKEVV